jgi:protein SMG6
MMMALINVGAVLEYGRASAILLQASGINLNTVPGANAMANGKVKLMTKQPNGDEKRMDVDEDGDEMNGLRNGQLSPMASEATAATPVEPELPLGLKCALQLTFSILSHVLGKPTLRRTSALADPQLNPYISILLTFVATVLKDKAAAQVITRWVPWEALSSFLSSAVPRRVMQAELQKEHVPLLSSGCYPLPEDWCLRGLGWTGKKVYERGFWDKATRGEERSLEAEVLDKTQSQSVGLQDGIIEDDVEDDENARHRAEVLKAERYGRWIRVARSAIKITRVVHGFAFTLPTTKDGRVEWSIEGQLADRVARWREEARLEKLEEERRRMGTRWGDDDEMDVDEEHGDIGSDDDEVSDEVKALKVSPPAFTWQNNVDSCIGTVAVFEQLPRHSQQGYLQAAQWKRPAGRRAAAHGTWVYYPRDRHKHSTFFSVYFQLSRRKPALDCGCTTARNHGTRRSRVNIYSPWRRGKGRLCLYRLSLAHS